MAFTYQALFYTLVRHYAILEKWSVVEVLCAYIDLCHYSLWRRNYQVVPLPLLAQLVNHKWTAVMIQPEQLGEERLNLYLPVLGKCLVVSMSEYVETVKQFNQV